MPVTLADAQAACEAAGKHLCTATEFLRACGGPHRTIYAYGDVYDPVICNSIDTYCLCDSSACEAIEECPYAHCYNQPPDGESEPLAGCTASFQIMPTGSFPDCTNEYGVYDINGNTWELVNDGSGQEVWRGGAFNCKDSETLHRCDYVGRDIAARGFRCCSPGRR
jgi:formylglycine-generating enzyme required for sulfatase activity